MHKVFIAVLAVCLAALVACNDDGGPEQDEFSRNRAKWDSAGISDYVYHLDVRCFCLPQETIVVTVSNDVVSDGFFTPSGVQLDPDRLATLRTLDEFFVLIEEAFDSGAEVVEVTYDATFGFPENIYVDRSSGIADEEVRYLISNFQ